MSDRWDEEDEAFERSRRGRERERELEPEREPTLGELIEGSVRKLVTGIIIAGGLIALGTYGAGRGGSSAPNYQITTSADGRTVYRLNTDSGSIVACLPRSASDNHCWLMQRGNRNLEDEPLVENSAAAPAPAVQAQPAPPPAVTAQPAAPQLPAPQNTAAPAAR